MLRRQKINEIAPSKVQLQLGGLGKSHLSAKSAEEWATCDNAAVSI
jgi:hypothetical protein